jgi:hypothetical protein
MRAGDRTTRRARWALVVAAAVAVVGAGLAAGAVPVTVTATPVAGWSTNGPVYATAIIGNTVYAGGSFTQVRSQGGGQTVTRTNLAAFDRATGAVRTGFAADANGIVRALTTDGTRLFVGGSFTTIGAQTRSRLAALDPTTGAVNATFVANANSHVYALARSGTRLVVGGAFSAIGGVARTRLAAVSTATGAVDASFAPSVNATVTAVAASPNGATVYAGGEFTSIGGAARNYFGAVSATTGANTGLVLNHVPKDQVLALDVSPDGAQIFMGSVANRAAAYKASTGTRQWYLAADGDVQAIRYFNGNVFFGFHDGFGDDTAKHLLAADATTGVLEPWTPTINSFWGVWAIAAGTDTLAVGGEFTTFSGVNTQGVAVLGPNGAPPPTTSSTTTSTTSTTSSTSTTSTTTTTTPSGGTNGALAADTYVNTESPTKNYGASTVLKLHSPTAEYRPLVRFTLSGLSAAPRSVRLRLYVTDGSTNGGAWYRVADAWDESTVVWSTAPAVGGAPVASVGSVTTGTWVEVDLTAAVTGNGTYSFVATSPSTNTAQFASRESATPPSVVIVP